MRGVNAICPRKIFMDPESALSSAIDHPKIAGMIAASRRNAAWAVTMMLVVRLLCASLFLLFPLAIAAASPPNAATRQACIGDAIKFCNSVIQDLHARQACMRAHRAELSDGCKAALAKQFGLPKTAGGTKPPCDRFCFNRCMSNTPAASSRTSCLDRCIGRCSLR